MQRKVGTSFNGVRADLRVFRLSYYLGRNSEGFGFKCVEKYIKEAI